VAAGTWYQGSIAFPEKRKLTFGALALSNLLVLGASTALAAGPKPPAPGLEAPTFAVGGTVPGDKPGTTIQAPSSDFTFTFGIRPIFQIRRVENLDFDSDRPEPARACDSTNAVQQNNCSGDFNIRLENRIAFRASREDQHGEVWNLDMVLETDGGLDGISTDAQHVFGIERLRGEYRIGDMVQAGLPVYLGIGWWTPLWDPFGIVDADDDPSVRLAYAGDLLQAEVMWTQDIRGDLGNAFGAPSLSNDLEIVRARVIIPLGDYVIQPTFYFQDDKTVNTGTTVSRDVTTWYAGGTFSGKPKGLPIDFFITGYILQGSAERLGTSVNANGVAFGATTSFDVSSFFIGGDIGYTIISGWRVHVGAMFAKGDDDPFDNDLKGFVDLGGQCGSVGPQLVSTNFFKNSFPAWGAPSDGCLPTGHGIGPSIGSIGRDARGRAGDGNDPFSGTLGNVSPAFAFTGPGTAVVDLGNNGGFGRGDNPGMLSVFGGVDGKLSPTWSLKFLVTALWFDAPESVEAGIDQARCILATGSTATCNTGAGVAAGSAAFLDTRTGVARGTANIDPFFGTMLELSLTWQPIPQFALSLKPSLLFPGGAVGEMGRFAPGVQKEVDDTAWAFQTELAFRF